ncbi:immunity 17 family protein [Bacteroides sedimenti]|uniref:immunity 17 family protein n=1 Tax=Bacteroides sedimenti TaxID=2136147 RepID=UPI00334049B9
MWAKYFVQGLFALAGIISFLAALLDWNWFFSSQNIQFLVRNVGRRWARIIYGIFGLILIGASAFIFCFKGKS